MLRTAVWVACPVVFCGLSPGAARAAMMYASSVIDYSS
jgi:hypothetical protein